MSLAGREYELLVKLATEPARVFTKEELLRDVWGFRSHGTDAHDRFTRFPPPAEAERGERRR